MDGLYLCELCLIHRINTNHVFYVNGTMCTWVFMSMVLPVNVHGLCLWLHISMVLCIHVVHVHVVHVHVHGGTKDSWLHVAVPWMP